MITNRIELDKDSDGTDDVLLCPVCKGNYLHRTHFREEPPPGDGFEFPRGGSIAIEFRCEACPALPTLHIGHHKGQTFLSWDRASLDRRAPPKP
ncbi:MAG: hypothetical protein ACLPTF_19615 [Steroidobacteraceae bacterium]